MVKNKNEIRRGKRVYTIRVAGTTITGVKVDLPLTMTEIGAAPTVLTAPAPHEAGTFDIEVDAYTTDNPYGTLYYFGPFRDAAVALDVAASAMLARSPRLSVERATGGPAYRVAAWS